MQGSPYVLGGEFAKAILADTLSLGRMCRVPRTYTSFVDLLHRELVSNLSTYSDGLQ